MAGFFQRSVDFFWAAVAAVLIACAALVSIVRLLLPEIGAQRHNLEAWIAEVIGRPAVVGSIDASWSGWSPRISVTDISFMDPSGADQLVHFERAVITISPLASLATGSLKPRHLTLSGVQLTLIRHEDGRITVAGMPPPKSPIIVWLMQQNNFTVTEADLEIVDEQRGTRFALSDVAVGIRSRGTRRFLNGYLSLPAEVGDYLAFELSADRSPLEPDWEGTLNVRVGGARLDYVAKQAAWRGETPPDAPLEVLAWTHWRGGQVWRARFDARVADAPSGAAAGGLAHGLQAAGWIERFAQGWDVGLERLVLPSVTGSSRAALAAVRVRVADGAPRAVTVAADALPIEPLAAIAAGFDALPERLAGLLTTGRPSGYLFDVEAAWRGGPSAGYFAAATLEHASLNGTASTPGLTGVNAIAELNARGGRVRFDGDDFRLDHDERLPEPLAVANLTGSVSWRSADEGLQVETPALTGTVETTALDVAGRVVLKEGESPRVDLAVGFASEDATRLHLLVPNGVLPPRGEAWSRSLFRSGRVTGGRAALRGRLADFPFDDATGRLQVDFDVADATLQYSRRWPIANGVAGRVRVRGRRAKFDVAEGSVEGAGIGGAVVTMPDMFTRERYVRISGTARGPAEAARRIVLASPLRLGRARRLEQVDIGGDIEVDLDMNLAVFPGGPREVLGQARFDGNPIANRALRLALDDVRGTVTFTRGDWYGEGLTANYEGVPVGLVLNGGLDDPNYDSEFRMTGTSDAAHLMQSLQRFAPTAHRWLERAGGAQAVTGSASWKAVLTIPTEHEDAASAPRRLLLESTLAGLGIDLPWPFGKHPGELRPVRLELATRPDAPNVTRIDLSDALDVEIETALSADGARQLRRMEILFGTVDPEFSGTPGISMRGYVPMLPLNEWAALMGSPADADHGEPGLPVGFDVQVRELRVLGRKLSDIRIAGVREPGQWNVALASLGTNGRLLVPHDLDHGTLVLELESLHLERVTETQPGTVEPVHFDIDPTRLPEVRLRCAAFRFEDIDFGRAELATSRLADGVRLDSLRFENEAFTISADGSWLQDDGAHTSTLNIAVDSNTLSDLLDRFGYTAANIEGGDTDMDIVATWGGTPADFALDRIAGTFELHVSDGRFLDIEPGGGRLFGLLSLQTLPRRLSLDFNDLFRKGFAFDSIDGVFEIENGNAYTNSLLMEGPSARIDVSGRIGLADQDYDQHVVVTPALSSSIPVASALFGPIGVGAGAVYFIGGKMFKSIPEQVNKFLSREYSITGSWERPVIERI